MAAKEDATVTEMIKNLMSLTSVAETVDLDAVNSKLQSERDELASIVRALADNHTIVIEGQETTPRGAAIWWCDKHRG